MTEDATVSSSIPVMDSIKTTKKKKLHQNKETRSSATESKPQVAVIETSDNSAPNTQHTISHIIDKKQITPPRKKKKKNTKKKIVEGQSGDNLPQAKDGEVEDVAESVDSGCIADSFSEILPVATDWPQV